MRFLCDDQFIGVGMVLQKSVCSSIHPFVHFRVSENKFQFLQLYQKMSLIKISWYVLRVKNMHFGPNSDPLDPQGGTKPSYVYLSSHYCFIFSCVNPKQLCNSKKYQNLNCSEFMYILNSPFFIHVNNVLSSLGPKMLLI